MSYIDRQEGVSAIKQGEPIERFGVDLPEEVAFEQGPERRERRESAIQLHGAECFRGSSKCKGPGVESYLCSRKSKEANRARGE